MNIVITGCSSGIGFELARHFCREEGNSVVAVSRNQARLQILAEECNRLRSGSVLTPVPFDLASEDLSRLVHRISQEIHSPDILINNAGLLINKPFEDLTPGDFEASFTVNVRSAFFLIQGLIPLMKPGSHIVNISSMGGFQGSMKFPGLSVYSASKGALAVLTECLAAELQDKGIRINCLALGAVQTEMLGQAFPGYKADITATEIAEFIFDFAVKSHHFINGKIIPVTRSTP